MSISKEKWQGRQLAFRGRKNLSEDRNAKCDRHVTGHNKTLWKVSAQMPFTEQPNNFSFYTNQRSSWQSRNSLYVWKPINYRSVQCVCVRACVRARVSACVRACVCIFHIVVFEHFLCLHYELAFVKLLITVSISMNSMCVLLCLFSALSRRVGALQISIILLLSHH